MIDERQVESLKDEAATEAAELYVDRIVSRLLEAGATEDEIARALDYSVHIHKGLLHIGEKALLMNTTWEFTGDPERIEVAVKEYEKRSKPS